MTVQRAKKRKSDKIARTASEKWRKVDFACNLQITRSPSSEGVESSDFCGLEVCVGAFGVWGLLHATGPKNQCYRWYSEKFLKIALKIQ